MIHKYLQYQLENFAKEALKTANDSIIGGIQEAVKIKLAEVQKNLKISAKIDR